MNLTITNANIILEEDSVIFGTVIIKDGIITNISDQSIKSSTSSHDAQGNFLSPGLFETHIHGQDGISLEDVENKEDIKKFHKSLQKNGVNTYLPTFACNEKAILKCLDFFDELQLFNSIPGIYIEGPFISPQKKGALNPDFIKDPDTQIHYMEELWQKTKGRIKMMTFAPELKGAKKLVDFLLEKKIIPSIGHTAGTYNDAKKFTHIKHLNITHLYNAMTPISHRDSGIAITPFLEKDIFFELITDGLHVDNDVVNMTYKSLNKDRMTIISDASSAAGCPYGEYKTFSKTSNLK